ncbi:uncharacterized protein [Antedon mediterranea]|uniref:uncharacterized protein n=1 Tax=Antedon mediterranea TaxID=105859 RepID=UPI003AF47D22
MSSVARRKSLKTVNLKKLNSDDIGQLKDTRASELGTIVKCHNHAYAVSVKREVAQWYNEQNIAITKLSHGQQKVYKNLLKFHQIKKDIKRKAYINKQIEIQEKLREKAALEKRETELKKISEKKTNNVKKKKDLVQIRKEKSILRSKYQVLPGIGEEKEMENTETKKEEHQTVLTEKSNTQVTFEDEQDSVLPPTRASLLLTPELSDLSGRISVPTYSIQPPNRKNENFPHRYIEPPQNVSRGNSFMIPKVSPTTSPVKEHSFVDVIQRTESLVIQKPLDSDASLIEVVNKVNSVGLSRNDSFTRMKMTPPHFSRKPKSKSNELGDDSRVDSRTSRFTEESNCLHITSSPHKTDINPHTVLPSISNVLVLDDTSCKDFDAVDGTNSLLRTTGNGKLKRKKRLDQKSKLLDDMNKYHVGILNRTFRLPNYQVPQIQHVTRYTKNSQGSLVPSELTVKPASEEFKLPSNRKAYMLRKALTTERANEPERERKLKEFFGKMSDMDREVQITRSKSKTMSGRREPFRHHKPDDFSHSSTMRNNVYGYILGTAQGDVTDVKNCRYLRTNEHMGSRRGKVSSWGKHY